MNFFKKNNVCKKKKNFFIKKCFFIIIRIFKIKLFSIKMVTDKSVGSHKLLPSKCWFIFRAGARNTVSMAESVTTGYVNLLILFYTCTALKASTEETEIIPNWWLIWVSSKHYVIQLYRDTAATNCTLLHIDNWRHSQLAQSTFNVSLSGTSMNSLTIPDSY